MAPGKGNNSGFYPFRDSRGRVSASTRARATGIAGLQPRKGGGQMNKALRSASGRATADGGSGAELAAEAEAHEPGNE